MSTLRSGTADAAGTNHTRLLVITRTKEEDVSWIEKELPGYETAIYVADDQNATLHPPKNKGHEVMVYLTYIIDNYDNLSDVTLFMHAHRFSGHNNELFGHDAVQTIKRLSTGRVIREGYVNLRCSWTPGCPDWMHPRMMEEDIMKQEQFLLGQSWSEIFPMNDLPEVLAQPCCAQFALSKERIQSVPRARFVFYRNWLMRTPISDYISGRIWEYIWHFVFTGQNIVCPAMHVCYCDAYGLCLGGKADLDEYFELLGQRQKYKKELRGWDEKLKVADDATTAGFANEAVQLEIQDPHHRTFLTQKLDAITEELDKRKNAALIRGEDPRIRAEEAGRDWNLGDGF